MVTAPKCAPFCRMITSLFPVQLVSNTTDLPFSSGWTISTFMSALNFLLMKFTSDLNGASSEKGFVCVRYPSFILAFQAREQLALHGIINATAFAFNTVLFFKAGHNIIAAVATLIAHRDW
ncbi:hypothetical protein ACO0LG_06915 [Undibacterium sp. Ji42W]|uniref:hypothetical protein n=1 Tax=Undibacterium sp. Ji42W TaxID=3413039 RepID=UPI003BF3EA3F